MELHISNKQTVKFLNICTLHYEESEEVNLNSLKIREVVHDAIDNLFAAGVRHLLLSEVVEFWRSNIQIHASQGILVGLVVVVGAEGNQEFLLEYFERFESEAFDVQHLEAANEVKELQEALAALQGVVKRIARQVEDLESVVTALHRTRQAWTRSCRS